MSINLQSLSRDGSSAAAFAGIERKVLDLLISGAPLNEILACLVLEIEACGPGLLGSILLLDEEGRRLLSGAAPNLPTVLNEGIHHAEIGPRVGSCGTAAYFGRQVIVRDIASDPLWENYRSLALPYGLRACWSTPIKAEDGRVLGTFAFYYRESRDPSPEELARVEQAVGLARFAIVQGRVQERLHLLDAAVARSNDAVLITEATPLDEPGPRIVFANGAFERITGYSLKEIVGRSPRFLQGPKTDRAALRRIREALERHEAVRVELVNYTREGRSYFVEIDFSPVTDARGSVTHFIAVHRDITERKRLESQMLQAQRLESIGTLAGGIAHDLNNVLAPILMAANMLKDDVSDPQARELIETVAASANRGAALVKQILLFARGDEGRRAPLAPADLLRDLNRILTETFPRNIRIDCATTPGTDNLMGDPTQVHQVLLNLCVNARDAMPSGGLLRVNAASRAIDEAFCRQHLGARPGRYVCITISDTGMGIAEDVQPRIFDPFFTTKGVGEGTGLGLSTTLAIVKNHQGFLTFGSRLGAGTTFHVYFPATTESTRPKHDSRPPIPIDLGGAGQLILVVDDEEMVRQITRSALEKAGYRVAVAQDGADAIAQFSAEPGSFDLVLLDMQMPVMDGFTTAQELRKIRPSVRLVGASGFATRSVVEKGGATGVQHFLDKPFSVSALLRAVQSALVEA